MLGLIGFAHCTSKPGSCLYTVCLHALKPAHKASIVLPAGPARTPVDCLIPGLYIPSLSVHYHTENDPTNGFKTPIALTLSKLATCNIYSRLQPYQSLTLFSIITHSLHIRMVSHICIRPETTPHSILYGRVWMHILTLSMCLCAVRLYYMKLLHKVLR